MENLPALLQEGLRHGLLGSSLENIESLLAAHPESYERSSIAELASSGNWEELNNRFFRTLAFGTGGLRGKTIGTVVTTAERGIPQAMERPQFPCTGTNAMNDRNVSRATQGLVAYVKDWARREKLPHRPRICISYDTRYFSREFADLAAKVITELGCDALVFAEPRPTPELSFAVRQTDATAGINLTASHNPSAYNGYKVYFNDGGQVIEPHASGIIARVNAVPSPHYEPVPRGEQGRRVTLGTEMDESYLDRLERVVLDPALVAREKGLKIVYSPLHGVGASIIMPLLRRLGFDATAVPEQVVPDSRFPTVKSPNPEYAEALTMALELADEIGADVVMATDPDDDRMGVAVRNRDGKMELLTGNQIGSLLAEYRLTKYKERGLIPAAGSDRVCLVKTFVTTRLQDAIGAGHGVKVINTLTGFKWIAAKMRGYEDQLRAAIGDKADDPKMTFKERAKFLQEHATFYAFGTEESYGYLPNDYLRDKDGNSACLMFAELCAAVKSRGITVPEYLDEIYIKYGFYLEGVINIYYEGASGSAKIERILETYRSSTPTKFGDVTVTKLEDFGRQDIYDEDKELIPKQDLYFVTLSNGYSFAARGSGTEPKMKIYLFANADVSSADELPAVKAKTKATLDGLIKFIDADAWQRAEG